MTSKKEWVVKCIIDREHNVIAYHCTYVKMDGKFLCKTMRNKGVLLHVKIASKVPKRTIINFLGVRNDPTDGELKMFHIKFLL